MNHETICAGELALEIVWKEGKIEALRLHWSKDVNASAKHSEHGAALQQTLQDYVKGKRVQWPELPLNMDRLPPFSRRALEALQNVPHGKYVTYGQLADMAGSPGGAQAAGRAMANNPWPLVYPCHRVIAGTGAMTGFSAPGGVEMKQFLLQLEGAVPRPAKTCPLPLG